MRKTRPTLSVVTGIAMAAFLGCGGSTDATEDESGKEYRCASNGVIYADRSSFYDNCKAVHCRSSNTMMTYREYYDEGLCLEVSSSSMAATSSSQGQERSSSSSARPRSSSSSTPASSSSRKSSSSSYCPASRCECNSQFSTTFETMWHTPSCSGMGLEGCKRFVAERVGCTL